MAVQETNLGHFDYIGLYNKDAVRTTFDNALDQKRFTTNWKWQLPNLYQRRGPVMFVSVISAYCDDSQGVAGGGGSNGVPHFLRMKVFSENFKALETSMSPIFHYTNQDTVPQYITYPIVSSLIRDVGTGHWYSLSQDSLTIQIPTNTQYLEFDLVDGQGNLLPICSQQSVLGNASFQEQTSLNITLKITYPERTEVMANTIQTYQKSVIGNTHTPNTF